MIMWNQVRIAVESNNPPQTVDNHHPSVSVELQTKLLYIVKINQSTEELQFIYAFRK